jgi:hypothetical protein
MPIWGRKRPPTKGIEPATGDGLYGELPGVQALARLARQEGLDPVRMHRDGTSVRRAYLTPDSTKHGRVRTILCSGPDPDHLDHVQVSYEAPTGQLSAEDAFDFIARVLDSLLAPEQRTAAAEWILTHPQGGILELPGMAIVLSRAGSSSTSTVGCTVVFPKEPIGQPARRPRPPTSPIRVPAVIAFTAHEGLVPAETTHWGEYSRSTFHAPDDRYGQRMDGRQVIHEAFDDALVTGLTVRWVFQWGLPPEAGWDFLDRARAALLPVAEQDKGLGLSKRLLARHAANTPFPFGDRDELPSGPLEIRVEESGLTWAWSLRQGPSGK